MCPARLMHSRSKKSFLPARVNNPTADWHSAPLCPNQDLIVTVSSWMKIVDLDFTSSYFTLDRTDELKDGTKIFYFKQLYDLTAWAALSNVYLGSITVVAEEYASTICVFLKSEIDIMTVINPNGCEVKLPPHHILEVVLYDTENPMVTWNFNRNMPFPSNSINNNLNFKVLSHQTIASADDDKVWIRQSMLKDGFPCFPRAFDGFVGHEHHFWLRLADESEAEAEKLQTGTYRGSTLMFGYWKLGQESIRSLHTVLNIRSTNRVKIGAPRLPDSEPSDIGIKKPKSAPTSKHPGFAGGYAGYATGHSGYGGYSHYRPPYTNTTTTTTTYHQQPGNPLAVTVVLRLRALAQEVDPLFYGTKSIDISQVTETKKGGRYYHDD